LQLYWSIQIVASLLLIGTGKLKLAVSQILRYWKNKVLFFLHWFTKLPLLLEGNNLNNQQKGVAFEVEQDHHFSASGKTEK